MEFLIKEGTQNIIGKKYRPIDNSWAVCLADGENHRLAGTLTSPQLQQVVVIISPVFKNRVTMSFGCDDHRTYEKDFVFVKDSKGFIHSVMYSTHGLLEATGKEAING